MELIDKAALVGKIKHHIKEESHSYFCKCLLSEIDTLEVKEVDLEKLGEIARHLIAVKEHIEDMRLDKEELFILEKIAYPERLKAQKGE